MENLTPPKGEKIADTVEAWKYHAYRMANLVESQRDEINELRQKNNQLRQKLKK